jgi:hypothetical protein
VSFLDVIEDVQPYQVNIQPRGKPSLQEDYSSKKDKLFSDPDNRVASPPLNFTPEQPLSARSAATTFGGGVK